MPNPPKRCFLSPRNIWEGRHKTYTQNIEGLHSFKVFQPANNAAARLEAYNSVTKEFQGLIGEAVQSGKTLRAYGSSWSLSKVAVTDHHLISSKNLRLRFTLPANQVSSHYAGDRKKLRFLECGYTIGEINRILYNDGLSLKTSGSNNGQTLPGVVGTGTHGSAFKFGATQDFIVGIHLITGSNSHVYLERKSYPVTRPSFSAALGAKLRNGDDDLFNAALVSFGSFGIVHGLMVETRELFLLDAFRSFRNYNAGLRKAISKLEFSGLNLPRPVSKLHHFQLTFNPNENHPPKRAAVYFMFERTFTPAYTVPDWDDGAPGPGATGLEIMGTIIGIIPNFLSGLIKSVLNTQIEDELKPYAVTGTIRDLFQGEKTMGMVYASGVGVPLDRALDTLNIALDTYANFSTVLPVLITMRYVKRTQALLGFTKFDTTCVLEIDGLNTDEMHDYANSVWGKLEQVGIPFTMHWGKVNNFLTADRLKTMYGADLDNWIAAREELLDAPEVRDVFANEFVKSHGLAT